MRRYRNWLATLAVVALLGVEGGSRAEAAVVTSTADSGPGSLRQAIAAAVSGETITFNLALPVTLALQSELLINKNLTVQGPTSGQGVQVVLSGEDNSRIFRIESGRRVTIARLGLEGGSADDGDSIPDDGGGIANAGVLTLSNCTLSFNQASGAGGGIANTGSLTATDCGFFANFAQSGGGIASTGTLTVRNCTFFFNRADETGGGLRNVGAAVLTGCTFLENSAESDRFIARGGGITNVGNLTATDCVLQVNRAEGRGGGIINGGTLAATRCTLTGNSTFGNGGGLNNAGTAILNDCTLDGNGSPRGGGAFNTADAGSLTLTRCSLSGNGAGSGGGLFNDAGSLRVESCTFSGNAASEAGGGIASSATVIAPGAVTVRNSLLAGNRAGAGGAFHSDDPQATATFTGCTLSSNHATASGGAVSHAAGVVILTGCRLANNSAERHGGGIHNRASLTLSQCTFFANFAPNLGGGLFHEAGELTLGDSTLVGNGALVGAGLFTNATATVLGCTLNGNIANEGAGLFNQAGVVLDDGPAPPPASLTLGNCTLSGNRAFQGGGMFNLGNVLMTNCTLFGNRADEGGGIRNRGNGRIKMGNTLAADSGAGRNYQGAEGSLLISIGNNLDSDGSGALTEPTDQSGTPAVPLDPRLGPLQDNGGPTHTHALLSGSPAIDRGEASLRPAETDQRGFARIADGNLDGIAVIDIGAFELSFWGTRGFAVRPDEAFLFYSTVQAQSTELPPGTESFNLTVHYSPEILPETFTAQINGQDITHLFNPATDEGQQTVEIPLRMGANRLVLKVKGRRNGTPATDVDTLDFRVGDPPPRPR